MIWLPAAKAVIFLLKFSKRTGGIPPSPPAFPSWGECSNIFPPVVPHAKEGLFPSTRKRNVIVNYAEMMKF